MSDHSLRAKNRAKECAQYKDSIGWCPESAQARGIFSTDVILEIRMSRGESVCCKAFHLYAAWEGQVGHSQVSALNNRKISLPCCFLNFREGRESSPSRRSKAWHGSSSWVNSESYYDGTSPEQPGSIPACLLLDHFMGTAGRQNVEKVTSGLAAPLRHWLCWLSCSCCPTPPLCRLLAAPSFRPFRGSDSWSCCMAHVCVHQEQQLVLPRRRSHVDKKGKMNPWSISAPQTSL